MWHFNIKSCFKLHFQHALLSQNLIRMWLLFILLYLMQHSFVTIIVKICVFLLFFFLEKLLMNYNRWRWFWKTCFEWPRGRRVLCRGVLGLSPSLSFQIKSLESTLPRRYFVPHLSSWFSLFYQWQTRRYNNAHTHSKCAGVETVANKNLSLSILSLCCVCYCSTYGMEPYFNSFE